MKDYVSWDAEALAFLGHSLEADCNLVLILPYACVGKIELGEDFTFEQLT
jgi:hypothetical protein